jgi:hypothetical protein
MCRILKDGLRLLSQNINLSYPWLATLTLHPGSIAASADGRFGLGAILVVEDAETHAIVFVRKAQKMRYEFSSMLAFPGGMVRLGSHPDDLALEIVRSLIQRVHAETGLEMSLEKIGLLDISTAPTTRYWAKGSYRHTIVLPFYMKLTQQSKLRPNDSSIEEAFWRSAPYPW